MASIRFKTEGRRVLMLVDGRRVADMPWKAAQDCAKALQSVSKVAEEYDLANLIIADQAVLLRTGAPFGFTSHPKMQEEAAKEAAWNRDLRRYLPGGVKSREQLGMPSIIQHMPRGKQNASHDRADVRK